MPDIFNIGVSALTANQRILSTIGHNIANSSVAGFSRQRVDLSARDSQVLGGIHFGKGVGIDSVRRVTDQFLINQLRSSASGEQQLSAYHNLASEVTDIFADPTVGVSTAMQDFFNALHDVNDDPTSLTSRQVLLSAAGALTSRFHDQDARLTEVSDEVNSQVRAAVTDVNALAVSLSRINERILFESGSSGGNPPNDLLDERDRQLLRLSELVNVTAVQQSNGQLTITVGNGQLLVAGNTVNSLVAIANVYDPTRLEVAHQIGGGTSVITAALNSGRLGGALAVRTEVIDPARNALGRMAATLGQAFNAQHREGMDLNAALGGDFFTLPLPGVNAVPGNAGSIAVTLDAANVGGLTTADYRLQHNGSAFVLTNLATGAQQTLTGAGPFMVDGLQIAVTGAPAAGDEYLLQPMRGMARTIALAVDQARDIAVARPVKSAAASTNIGIGRITAPEVLNAASAGLLASTTLVFNNPPTTFQINGAGPLIAYADGAAIDVNGWRVRISGAPVAGDTFSVTANTAGLGDNGNGLLLAGLQQAALLESGTATLQDGYSALVGVVGAQTRQAELSADALSILRGNAEVARESVAGVNLDEEAANLLRFQQAYQAAARVIQVGNETINALLDALR